MTTGQGSLSNNHVNEDVLTTQPVVPDSRRPTPLHPELSRVARFNIDGHTGICIADILYAPSILNSEEREFLGGHSSSEHQCYLRFYVSHSPF